MLIELLKNKTIFLSRTILKKKINFSITIYVKIFG